MNRESLDTDVMVVGGGPAGLGAALALRQKGFRVTVADGAIPPIDKACGEGLMPDAVRALRQLGVSIGTDIAFPFRGIRFVEGSRCVEADFLQGPGWVIRRTALHALLVQRAADCGVSLLWGIRVNRIAAGEVGLAGRHAGAVRCKWIIGADGESSRVRQWMDVKLRPRQQIRYGFRQHFRVAPGSNYVEVHWGEGCQLVVAPAGPDEICIASVSTQPRARLAQALRLFPEVAKRLPDDAAISRERGAVSATRGLAAVCRGRVALIGDASGSVDSLTGEGLCLAFQQAVPLAEALAQGNLSQYQAAHSRIATTPFLIARLMLWMDKFPWLGHRALHVLMSEPSLFSRVLAIHAGGLSPLDFGVGPVLKFGWKFLANTS